MGLIRKSLMIGTAGVVKGSSKKQRNAKAQLIELKAQSYAMGIRTPAEQYAEERAAKKVRQAAKVPSTPLEVRNPKLAARCAEIQAKMARERGR